MPNLSEEELQEMLRNNPQLRSEVRFDGKQNVPSETTAGLSVKPKSKYGVAPKEDRTYNGVLYASKKEATFAQELDLRVKAGELSFWLRQVPFLLRGGFTYRLDFMVFCSDDRLHGHAFPLWDIQCYEVKGYETPVGRLKRKQCEFLYGIVITIV